MKYDFFKYIFDSIQYPFVLAENEISGKSVASFSIDFDGNAKEIKILTIERRADWDPILDAEVIKVIRSAPKLDFERYLQDNYDDLNGKDPLSIKILYILPVKFALEIERQTVNVYY